MEEQCNEYTPYNVEDFEQPWSQPSKTDYISMKFVADILGNPLSSYKEINNAISHLNLIMTDYPFEYFLQPPYIYIKLMNIYDERKKGKMNAHQVDVAARSLLAIVYYIEKSLKCQLKTINVPKINDGKKINYNSTSCQLKINKALSELLNASIYNIEINIFERNVEHTVMEILYSICNLHKIINKKTDLKILHKLSNIIDTLSARIATGESLKRLRFNQIQIMFLLEAIIKTNWSDRILPIEIAPILKTIIMDFTFFHPNRCKDLLEIYITSSKKLKTNFEVLRCYEKSLRNSLRMLTLPNTSKLDVLELGPSMSFVLDNLQSKQLINILFDGIIACIPFYLKNTELKVKATQLLQTTLQLKTLPLVSVVIDKMLAALKKHICCLMNEELYVYECPSNHLLLQSFIVGVPLSSALLLYITYSSYECPDVQIQAKYEHFLILLLQYQYLLKSSLVHCMPLLLPILSLLICYSKSTKLMDSLLIIFDPDKGIVPHISILQGNIGFLFHKDTTRRSEALSRLLFSLHYLNDSNKYTPNLLEISDILPNDICIVKHPVEYSSIFSDHSPLRCDALETLQNLYELLDSTFAEPLVRKTALMQLNILCSNWNILKEVCEADAIYLILKSLENAMQTDSCSEYADAAIPAVGILNKILLHDSCVRCTLSESPNIYILLFRALTMYHHDIQLKQDASMCLFQLLYSSKIISTENCIEAPLILENLHLPATVNLQPSMQHHHQNDALSSSTEENRYWRLVIAESCSNSFDSITQENIIIQQSKLDIADNLKLTTHDINFVKNSRLTKSMNSIIKSSSNVTDYLEILQLCSLILEHMGISYLWKIPIFSEESSIALYHNIFAKYLPVVTANSNDLNFFECLIELCILTVKIPMRAVVDRIYNFLTTDTQCSLIRALIQKDEITLSLYIKIANFLELLLMEIKNWYITTENKKNLSFLGSWFKIFLEHCLELLDKRDIPRIRCLLNLLAVLSAYHLYFPDKVIFSYCRVLLKLSQKLKSFAQTGARWHRDCLLTIVQLCDQMENSILNFHLSPVAVKYLSCLCGHCDIEVRILSWKILCHVAQSVENKDIETSGSGCDILLKELSYLPGGFLACCTSTMLDTTENLRVRHWAGNLFSIIIKNQPKTKKNSVLQNVVEILTQYKFIKAVTQNLISSTCVLSKELPEHITISSKGIIDCEMISCYVRICIELSLHSLYCMDDLYSNQFIIKLIEILKYPTPKPLHNSYIHMVKDMSKFYGLCYPDNFCFLQSTVCRDEMWLNNFCWILFIEVLTESNPHAASADMVQFLLVLLRDPTAEKIILSKMQEYSLEISTAVTNTLTVKKLNTEFQRSFLLLFYVMLTKYPYGSERNDSTIISLFENQLSFEHGSKITRTIDKDATTMYQNWKQIDPHCTISKNNSSVTTSVSDILCSALIELYHKTYIINACNFQTRLTNHQRQIFDTLFILLKVSEQAQLTAKRANLFEKILQIFESFFNQYSRSLISTHKPHYKEDKRLLPIQNLEVHLQLLKNWYSSRHTIITNETIAIDISKLLIRLWPLLEHSIDVRITSLQLCIVLCERSIVICKQFSKEITGTHSVLQLATKLAISETSSTKFSKTGNTKIVELSARILINCCSCIEGRTYLYKDHALDIFNSLLSFNIKTTRCKTEVLTSWLEFFEFFSRYEEGCKLRYFNSLYPLILDLTQGSKPRILSLRILRNMTFFENNCSIIINSTDFLFVVKTIISQRIKSSTHSNISIELTKKCSLEEEHLICISLWNLISNGAKYVAKIRSTKLARQLRLLRDTLNNISKEEHFFGIKFVTDLLNILNEILMFFEN